MYRIKSNLTRKFSLFIAFFSLLSGTVTAQEQFEKRFSISFNQEPVKDVLSELVKTQSDLTYSYGVEPAWMVPVTLDLKNVTLDEALDKILASQTYFKDYVITSYGTFKVLELFMVKSSSRYFDRQKNKGRYYHIGDRLPDSVYTVNNYPGGTIRLAGLKKKLIILDMWNIHCKGCIAAIPRMQKIQEKFKDQVQILLVTKDSKDQVELLKKEVRIVRESKLPSVTGENVLGSLFDYFYVPKQVWIDESGIIQYITNKEIGTEAYVKDFLAGKRLNLHELKDTSLGDDYDIPFATVMHPVNGGDFGISSYLAPHKEDRYNFNTYSGGSKDTDTLKAWRLQRIDFFNLYKIAYAIPEPGVFSNTRIIKNYPDPEKYDPDGTVNRNIYDYELITKKITITNKKFYHLMQGQLDAYFDLKSSLQRKKIPVYVLRRTGKTDGWLTKGATSDFERTDNIIDAINVSLGFILEVVNIDRMDKPQLVDETGLDAPKTQVDWHFDMDFENNLPAIQKSLAALGLSLTKEEREMDCIVLDVD